MGNTSTIAKICNLNGMIAAIFGRILFALFLAQKQSNIAIRKFK
jgi:hypothetical protein